MAKPVYTLVLVGCDKYFYNRLLKNTVFFSIYSGNYWLILACKGLRVKKKKTEEICKGQDLLTSQ